MADCMAYPIAILWLSYGLERLAYLGRWKVFVVAPSGFPVASNDPQSVSKT